ncbi:hypothetical protein SteCoe_38338 [Stentor coeruleus]|uniref:Uncharacterized protein n=1 Tax=Stentor coeruleus TaxID=5963 RepID=A0A1R2ALJ5_9CILI|nr:hypothetical protein SteCoe_38338 [Stentor coeruleus]
MFILFMLYAALGKLPMRNPIEQTRQPEKAPDDLMTLYTINPSEETSIKFKALNEIPRLKDVKFKVIDCVENKYYCEDKGANHLPYVTYKTAYKLVNFTWAHTYDDYKEFAIKMAGHDAITLGTIESMDEFSRRQSAFVMVFNPELRGIVSLDYVEDFRKLAREYKSTHVYLGTCHVGEVAYRENIKKSDLPIIKQLGNDAAYQFNITKPLTLEKMKNFIEAHKCTMKLEITSSYLHDALDCFKDKIVGISFVNSLSPAYSKPGHTNMLMYGYRGKNETRFQFAFVDTDKYPQLMDYFGVKEATTFVVADYRKGAAVFRYFRNFNLRDYTLLESILEKAWKREEVGSDRWYEEANSQVCEKIETNQTTACERMSS